VNKCIKKAQIIGGGPSMRGNDLGRVGGFAATFLGRQLILFLLVLSLTGLGSINSAYALGIGSADAESYIGERLLVRIPIFNVQNPGNLSVKLVLGENGGFGSDIITVLNASIERANSQLGVLVRSTTSVTEPYINFTLSLSDGQASFVKEFTVLLNLAPDDLVNNTSYSDQTQVLNSTQVTAEPITSASVNSTVGITNQSGNSVLGPYDFAEANNIPDKFGAVLDGQSLWRVARRINKALGVSINQMMLSLYQNNPDAFSTRSIDSLRAGTFLQIPSFAQASQLSDAEAKQALNRLSGSNINTPRRDNNQQDRIVTPDANIETPSQSQPFQLTAIDEVVGGITAVGNSVQGDEINSSINNEKTQEIINSLAQTVGNLTQELIRKDSQIKYLTRKVEALEAYANIEADTLLAENLESSAADSSLSAGGSFANDPSDLILDAEQLLSDKEFQASDEPVLDQSAEGSVSEEYAEGSVSEEHAEGSLSEEHAEGSVSDEHAEGSLSEEHAEGSVSDEPEVTNNAAAAPDSESISILSKWWVWVILGLLSLALFAVIFRDRVADIMRSLNFFGSNDSVDLDESNFREPSFNASVVDARQSAAHRDNNYSSPSALSEQQEKQVVIPEYRQIEQPDSAKEDFVEPIESTEALDHEEALEFEPYSEMEEEDQLPHDDDEITIETHSSYVELVTEDENIEPAFTDADLDSENTIDAGSELGDKLEIIDDDQQDLGFNERFALLLEQKDFEFARELLDFARHNEIDEQRYHCERLALLHAMQDEEGFYEYYYEIESKIPDFDQNLQTRISQLVVKLAQN